MINFFVASEPLTHGDVGKEEWKLVPRGHMVMYEEGNKGFQVLPLNLKTYLQDSDIEKEKEPKNQEEKQENNKTTEKEKEEHPSQKKSENIVEKQQKKNKGKEKTGKKKSSRKEKTIT